MMEQAIAGAMLFPASPRASRLSGQGLVADRGLTPFTTIFC